MKNIILILTSLSLFLNMYAQQVADTAYKPVIHDPAYEIGKGPVVYIDEGHHNFHTKEGRYKAFSNLVERDGYVVNGYEGEFERKHLSKGKILVISNALNEKNVQDWTLPNPSAFTGSEIEIIRQWVFDGNSLFLIADHMPMAGAARDLAAAFEFEFTNGFVFDTAVRGPVFFKTQDGTLIESRITKGRNDHERVGQIVTFTGQAFKIPEEATPVLVFDERYVNFLPDTAWSFNEKTERFNVGGWSQGAYMHYGKGRIVVFGEAAMFSAQLAGPDKIKAGMNHEIAKENYHLLLNIIHWLDGKIH
ncbi:MAG: hypothetical protein V3V53_08940 [Bacteroidales bacterium]